MRPATLRAMALPDIRQRIASATAPEQLEQLAAECDRRRSAGAAAAARTARLRCRALKAVATKRLRAPAAPARQRAPLSLVAFLVQRGGIRDPGGDLRAIMGTPKARVGLLNNRTGRTLDAAARLALDAGYFPEHDAGGRSAIFRESLAGAVREGGASAETMTPAALLDGIDAELRGRKRWPHGEAPEAALRQDRDAADRDTAAAMWQRLVAEADRAGVEGVYSFLFAGGVLTPTEEIPW